ncbi:hypothetical protein OESDEN_04545 [Oesophagostomum dentatum]|uniref:Uncharacterized protein n=1 Tax=Oesophagostomum dentatum TaxID=61180 RepID=A0A0B1TI57_OESDE|nr:hypothetical protein OESDEN_04545 [Oesophagostomum dentatum]
MAASLTNYSDPDKVPYELCERIADVLRNPYYRAAQFVTLFESIAALTCIIYAFTRYRKVITLHPNIILLLYTLYTLCFIHAVVYSISKIYQLYISFFVANPCHMFLPKVFYIVTFNILVFGNSGIRNAQIAMVIERSVATVLVNSYEKRCRALGVALIAVVVRF